MLHFLPTPYPDELWYSVLCRYHLRSGNTSPQHSAQDIFDYRKQKVSVELATDIQNVLDALGTPFLSAEDILANHTLLPFYARFWGVERKKNVIQSLASGGGSAIHKVGIFQSNMAATRVFRYCPECFAEDMKQLGEPYWHRAHQLGDIGVCVRHGCRLLHTGMPRYNHQQIFCPATPNMELSGNAEPLPTEQELALAMLLADSLWQPFDFEDGRIYAQVFDYHLKKQGWRSPTGKNTRTKYIAQEMRGFYESHVFDEDISADRLNTTFSLCKQTAPRLILQAAFFMGISSQELLTLPPLTDIVQEIRDRLAAGESKRSIARSLGVDAATVRRWSIEREPMRKKLPTCRKQVAKTDWDAMDAEHFPRLCELLGQGAQGKPQCITFTWAAKVLGTVSAAQLKKMPRCADIIHRHMEPIEQTWKKRLIWAEQQLVAEGKPVTETAVFQLAGVLKQRYIERLGENGLSK